MTFDYVLHIFYLHVANTRSLRKTPEVEKFLKKWNKEDNNLFENILASAVDGAASVVGRYRVFIPHLKNVVTEFFF